jgi:hypothetical protein
VSVADFDIEPVDEWQGFCEIHQCYYWYEYRCMGCNNDQADRAYDSMKDERETQP